MNKTTTLGIVSICGLVLAWNLISFASAQVQETGFRAGNLSTTISCVEFAYEGTHLVDQTVNFFGADNYSVIDFVQDNSTGTLEINVQQDGEEYAYEDTVSDFFACHNYDLSEYTPNENGTITIKAEVAKHLMVNIAPHNVANSFTRVTGLKVLHAEWAKTDNKLYSEKISLMLEGYWFTPENGRTLIITAKEAVEIVKKAELLEKGIEA